ncbi:MAG: hypothetical protein KF886_03550 [Candidatus Hydrogenedentes bacterium]|nr:hypothetical protein [Candidatus Hydrogenedentota bacterium]
MNLLLIATAAVLSADVSTDWELARILVAEHEHNARKASSYAATYKEIRWVTFRIDGIQRETEVEAHVEEVRAGLNLFVKRDETSKVLKGGPNDRSGYTQRTDLIRNNEYIAHFTYPYVSMELFCNDYHDIHAGPAVVKRVVGRGPSTCGFGDGRTPFSDIIAGGSENYKSFHCGPVNEGENVYQIEIEEETGLRQRILVDLSRGGLIVSSSAQHGDIIFEMEVVPNEFDGIWFPGSWKQTFYDVKADKPTRIFTSTLTSLEFNKWEAKEFTYEKILPSEDTLILLFTGTESRKYMYSVDGVLMDSTNAHLLWRDKAALQPGG